MSVSKQYTNNSSPLIWSFVTIVPIKHKTSAQGNHEAAAKDYENSRLDVKHCSRKNGFILGTWQTDFQENMLKVANIMQS